jgi:hypothetical protein
MRRYPLVCYFLLAFGLTWAFELLALLLWHVNYYGPWMAPAFFGPTLSALLLTAILEGKADVGRLLRGYVRWRVGLRWYLLVLLSALTVPGVVATFRAPAPHFLLTILLFYLVLLAFSGPLGEEAG